MEAYWRRSPMEREWHESRWAKRQGRCQHCGRDRSECSDPEKAWYPQREICYASLESEAAKAKWAAIHDERPWHDGSWTRWAAKRSDSHPYHRDHGLTIGVAETDLRPGDKFLARERWGPTQTDDDEGVDDGGTP